MWSKIVLLALGTFAIGTDGFIVAGVLREISHELDVPVVLAGQLVSLFAIVYALSGPLLASLTAGWPRRRLLLVALAVFVLGNALAAVASSFAVLLLARVIAALASAAYTPCASFAAASLAGARHRGKALSLVMGGITVATLVGVPLGTVLGASGGFRAAFWLVAGLGVLAFIGLYRWLPELPGAPPVALRERLRAVRLPGVPGTLLVTLLAMSAGFSVYTYLGPLLDRTLHADARMLAVVLVAFGIAGTLGNLASGWLADHWGPARSVALSLCVVALVLGLLPTLATTLGGTLFAVCLWNAAGWLLLPAQQHRLLSMAGAAGPILLSLNASAMYLGIGLAGLLGALVIQWWGVLALGPAGAVMVVLALLCHGWMLSAGRRSLASEQGYSSTLVPTEKQRYR
ncbi:MAG: Purine efflux pump PbuE [Stenotrophomonas maltophilia]|nr:MAG: Purine efflux pump PbuE [Stenotrophomonas maltophilia]